MTALSNWHHITYSVPDCEEAGNWYADVLRGEIVRRTGYSEIDKRAGRNRQIWVQAGEAIVNLAEGEIIHRPEGFHFFHFAFRALTGEDLDFWMSHLKSHDITVFGPYGHGGAPVLSLYFDDPWGYRLEIVFDFESYEVAKEAALSRGGALGNPESEYRWE